MSHLAHNIHRFEGVTVLIKPRAFAVENSHVGEILARGQEAGASRRVISDHHAKNERECSALKVGRNELNGPCGVIAYPPLLADVEAPDVLAGVHCSKVYLQKQKDGIDIRAKKGVAS